MNRSIGFLNGFQLKVLMAVLMLLDHMYYGLFPRQLFWAHVAARVVMPVFCYLMTEAMHYTRSRPVYVLRMLVFGLVMAGGSGLLYLRYGVWIENNIFLALTLGAAVITCADKAIESRGGEKLLWAAGVVGIYALSFLKIGGVYVVEGAYMLPLMAVLFYYMRERPVAMWALYFLVFCAPYLLLVGEEGLHPQFWMLLAVIPILCYNGERGNDGLAAKYFFYVFYPAHIWIIFLLEQAWGI